MLYKEKILLIHKSKVNREKIAVYLRELQYAVIIAENIEEVYNLARSTHPDLVLWGTPITMDGKRVLKKIKRARFSKTIPLIAMIDDIELYDRIELEKHGIDDVIVNDPPLTELRLKIRLHLDYIQQSIQSKKEINRLQSISEIQYNIAIVNDINRLSELFDDYLFNEYPFDFVLQLIYNNKTGDYDYHSFNTRDPQLKEDITDIFEQPVWKENYFSAKVQTPEKISDKSLVDAFKSFGLSAELYYQMPLHANKKSFGIIIAGCEVKNALTDVEFNDLSVLVNSAGHRIFELKRVYSGLPAKPEEKPNDIFTTFQRFKDEQVFEYLAKQILHKLKTDVSIYFNYNKAFRFLYPQYCFVPSSQTNLFEDEKPPVLMSKDFPTFEKFIDSKRKSDIYNLTKTALPDIAAIAELSGGKYNSVVVFSVAIGNEVQGYLVTANESSMKRFSSVLIKEAEQLIQKATDVLMESRLIKQANQTIKQLDRVFELGKEVTLESHIDELLPKIATAIRRTLGWNIVIMDKKDPYSGLFSNVCYYGIQKKIYKGIQDKYPDTMYKKLKANTFKLSNSYFLDHKYALMDIQDTDHQEFLMKIGKQWNDRDWLFVPIQSRGRELGVISVNDPVDRLRPNEEKVRSLEYFANQAAVALENDALYQDLKSSETKYRTLAETMTMGLVTCTFIGEIIYNNPSFALLLQYEEKATFIGRNIYDMCSDKSRVELEKYVVFVSHPQNGNQANDYEAGLEIELKGKDGKGVPFKIFLTKSFEKGKEKGFLGVLSDLRPQRRIERLKADFNSMVVHDLRSPLNIIQGYIDIVRNRVVGDISTEQEELLSIAKENCYKVLKLIDNFLIASKLEVGSFDITQEVNALNTLIESVTQNHKVLAQKKNITIDLIVDSKVPLMTFDKMRIEQVITNYLSNALKFTKEGGIIEVGSKLVLTKKELTGESQKEVHVWVKDSGVGISKEEQEKVFNKYEQTEAGKDASLKGTGLGLAICKEIVTLHMGKVWLESIEGKGSIFYFSLPVIMHNVKSEVLS